MEPSSTSSPAEWKPTVSQEDQWALERQLFHIYQLFCNIPPKSQAVMLKVQRDNHIEYLIRPWMCYWILHSIALLGESVDDASEHNAIDFDQHGGYGGGPGQMPDLAKTYAAVNSLITLGGHRSLGSINSMHDGGEVDVGACYTAIFVASALNILDEELVQGVGDYIFRYTFCGLAAMILVNEVIRLDLPSLTTRSGRWLPGEDK